METKVNNNKRKLSNSTTRDEKKETSVIQKKKKKANKPSKRTAKELSEMERLKEYERPVTVCCLCFSLETNIRGIKDSKKFTSSKKQSAEYKRCDLSQKIRDQEGVVFSIVENSNKRIDEINILQATMECMNKAVRDVIRQIMNKESVRMDESNKPIKFHVLIDGNQIPEQLLQWKTELSSVDTTTAFSLEIETVEKGDSKCYSIAASSIVAKDHRDRRMNDLHELHPIYQWNVNKGYGTKHHIEMIRKHGRTDLHRNSFHIRALSELE